jgi:hypothetical protein
VTGRPRFLLVGGEVFDDIASAPSARQGQFLRLLREIRRNPSVSSTVEIDVARGDWGATPALLATLDGLSISYHVAGKYIYLTLVTWV